MHPVISSNIPWHTSFPSHTCGEVVYENQGTISTDPSHDLVHLIVAASGLPWLPQTERLMSCLAEYNAVFLETLFDKACNAFVFQSAPASDVLPEVLERMQWFVEEHFAPFPMSAAAAHEQFCSQINPFTVSRLFPFYLATKQYERTHSTYRESEYQLNFDSTDQPATDEAGWLAQWFIYQQLKATQHQHRQSQNQPILKASPKEKPADGHCPTELPMV